ncbi:MAG: hypothetical protein WBM17_09805 [Anaerolineales bacterium]
MKPGSNWQYGVLACGVAISAILVIVFPDFYHHGDIGIQMVWVEQWNKGWKEIYNTCSSCDYPIIGTFVAAGIPKLLSRIGFSDTVWWFRFCLAVVDGANVFLVFLLFRELKIKNAALWAGLIGVSLSSWAGGGVWGNIDDVSQFLLLLIVWWMVKSNLSGKIPIALYLGVCVFLTAMLFLTKHLNVFNLLSIEFILTVSVFIGRKRLPAAGYWLLQLALLFVFIFWWDLPLTIDGPYVSHLQLIWRTPGRLGDFLSNNGINIWMLLGRDMLSSSALPLFPESPVGLLRWLTPFNAGIGLFAIIVGAFSLSTAWTIWKCKEPGSQLLNREALLNGILHLALVNLAYNVLLTGTHERYLYNFYPFVLLACLGLEAYDPRFSKYLAALLLIGANVYGYFVLGILTGDFSFRFQVHKSLAVFHAGLLFLLLAIVFLYQRTKIINSRSHPSIVSPVGIPGSG